jgi:hypothetical protein
MISCYLQDSTVCSSPIANANYVQKVHIVQVFKNMWLKYDYNIFGVVKYDL